MRILKSKLLKTGLLATSTILIASILTQNTNCAYAAIGQKRTLCSHGREQNNGNMRNLNEFFPLRRALTNELRFDSSENFRSYFQEAISVFPALQRSINATVEYVHGMQILNYSLLDMEITDSSIKENVNNEYKQSFLDAWRTSLSHDALSIKNFTVAQIIAKLSAPEELNSENKELFAFVCASEYTELEENGLAEQSEFDALDLVNCLLDYLEEQQLNNENFEELLNITIDKAIIECIEGPLEERDNANFN